MSIFGVGSVKVSCQLALKTKTAHITLPQPIPSDRNYRPFYVLLTAGLLVRVALMLMYWPAVMLSFDSPRYARTWPTELFGDFWMPAAYPMFLALLRAVTHQLWFSIAVQHLLGWVVGVILFVTLRRLNVKPWLACWPAAVALLSGDQLYLEHQLMADSLLLFLTVAGLGAAIFGLTAGIDLRWLGTASALLAMAAFVRSVGIILLPILLFCTVPFGAG